MLKSTTYIDKIGKFFDLCDDDNSGSIDKKEFYSLLKLNLNNYEDKKRLKTYVKQIFKDFDYDGDGTLGKKEMIEACLLNFQIRHLIESNVKSLGNLEKRVESDFWRQFETKRDFLPGQSINKNFNSVNHDKIHKLELAMEKSEAYVGYIKFAKTRQEENNSNL